MRDDSDFPHTNRFVFSTKSWTRLNSPDINKSLLFKVIDVFCYFFRFFSYVHIYWRLIPWKKVFLLLVYFPLQKN